jgi:hypothetical protein
LPIKNTVSISDVENPWRLNSGVSVRLFSPLGVYPCRIGFRQRDAAIVVRQNLIALITRFHPIPPPEEYYWSEVEMLSAFEVKVLGAVLISGTRDSGAFQTYPTSVEYRTADANFDLSNTGILSSLTTNSRSGSSRQPTINGFISHRA